MYVLDSRQDYHLISLNIEEERWEAVSVVSGSWCRFSRGCYWSGGLVGVGALCTRWRDCRQWSYRLRVYFLALAADWLDYRGGGGVETFESSMTGRLGDSVGCLGVGW